MSAALQCEYGTNLKVGSPLRRSQCIYKARTGRRAKIYAIPTFEFSLLSARGLPLISPVYLFQVARRLHLDLLRPCILVMTFRLQHSEVLLNVPTLLQKPYHVVYGRPLDSYCLHVCHQRQRHC